jgi:hypothetical protein
MKKTIISREEAIEQGSMTYFTGVACPHGHVAERYTSCGKCLTCHQAHQQRWYQNNQQLCRRRSREAYRAHPERDVERRRALAARVKAGRAKARGGGK